MHILTLMYVDFTVNPAVKRAAKKLRAATETSGAKVFEVPAHPHTDLLKLLKVDFPGARASRSKAKAAATSSGHSVPRKGVPIMGEDLAAKTNVLPMVVFQCVGATCGPGDGSFSHVHLPVEMDSEFWSLAINLSRNVGKPVDISNTTRWRFLGVSACQDEGSVHVKECLRLGEVGLRMAVPAALAGKGKQNRKPRAGRGGWAMQVHMYQY